MEYTVNTDTFFLSGFLEDKKLSYPDYRGFELELTPDEEETYEIKDGKNIEFTMDLGEAGRTVRTVAFSPKKTPWYQVQFLMKDKNGNYNQNHILIKYETQVNDKGKMYIIKRIIFLFHKNFF